MSGFPRRRFLAGAGAGAVGMAAGGAARAGRPRGVRFTHGVASGDPLGDRVILWTRAVARSRRPTPVSWVVARDRGLRRVVSRGTAIARPSADWTVKVDARGLEPGETYWFAFRAAGTRSILGRTRTAPAGALASATLAVVTCADYSRGLYNAYARVAERDDLDAVIHLGDYIYESFREERVRDHRPRREAVSLRDYRRRYATARSDRALLRLHRRHPMIWVWDDHETVNGSWRGGAEDHDENEGSFAARKLAARRAAYEWLPIRLPSATEPERIYRRFAFGDLIDLLMIDTRRIGRDRQGTPNAGGEFFTQTGEFADPSRQLLGAEQERWLRRRLERSKAAWKLIGNQVVFAQLKVIPGPGQTAVYANPDQWDGYDPARSRIADVLETVDDVVILTGDVHASLALEVAREPNDPLAYNPVTGDGAYAVELVTPSISSAGDPQQPSDVEGVIERLLLSNAAALQAPNPHLKYAEAERNGYLLLDVDNARIRAEFWLVPTVTAKSREQELDAAFVVNRGESRLLRD